MMQRIMVGKTFSPISCIITRQASACKPSTDRAKMLDDREDILMSEDRLVYQHH